MEIKAIFTACCWLQVAGAFLYRDIAPEEHGWIKLPAPEGIVGGEQVNNAGRLPYQILLLWQAGGLTKLCGGSLIIVNGEQVVITAAHCLFKYGEQLRAEDFTLIAGENNRKELEGHEQIRKISRMIVHENYQRRPVLNDIALLVLSHPFVLNKYVGPIPLPKPERKTTGEVLASGWGDLTDESSGGFSDNLQEVRMTVVDLEICRQAYAQLEQKVGPGFICAGDVEGGGKDACNGDSGGPLVAVDGGYLAGIISWGNGCGLPGFPGLSTEVSQYIDWIEKRVAELKRKSL